MILKNRPFGCGPVVLATMICLVTAPAVMGAAVSTALTYQGQLKQDGIPVSDVCDMRFSLYDDLITPPGVQDGDEYVLSGAFAVEVSNGLFTATLDFDPATLAGQARWLQTEVRCPSWDGIGAEPAYTLLAPRQPLTATPYALYALSGPGGSGAWDAAGVDIHNANVGNVGIGTDSPTGLLHVSGDDTQEVSIWGEDSVPLLHFRKTSNGDDWVFKHDGTKFHFQTEGAPGREIMTLQADGSVGIGTTSPSGLLQVGTGDGTMHLGASPALQFRRDLAVNKFKIQLVGSGYFGKVLQIGRDDGNHDTVLTGDVGFSTGSPDRTIDIGGSDPAVRMTDSDASGGKLEFKTTISGLIGRTIGSIDFINATNERRGGISYDESFLGSGLIFETAGTGNSSIQMPTGAISSQEMSNEPGAASTKTSGSCGFLCSNCVSQTSSVGTVTSRSINLPASGYVLAIATAEVNLFHTNGTRSSVRVGVSPTTSFQFAQDSLVSIPSSAPTGTYTQLVTVHGIYGPYSGTRTIRLLAEESTNSSSSLCDRTLTLVYIPTAYGTVTRDESDTTREGQDGGDFDIEQESWVYENEEADDRVSTEPASIAELSQSEADRLGLRFLELEREMADLRRQLSQATGDFGEED